MRVSLFILVKSLVVLGRETIRTMTECVTCVSPGSYVCQSYSANSFSMCCSEQNDWNTSGCIKSRAYDCSYEIDSTELQHFMCPFEKEWCGSSTKIQPSLYEAGTQAVTGAKYKFTQGSVCTWEISANRVNFDYINYSYQLYVSFQYLAGASVKVWQGTSKEEAKELGTTTDLLKTYEVDLLEREDMKIYIHVTGEAINPFFQVTGQIWPTRETPWPEELSQED